MKTGFAWKPVVAGVLLLMLYLPVFSIETVAFIKAKMIESPDANSAIVFMGLTAPAVLAGLCAIFRRVWWLALAGSILAFTVYTFTATPPLAMWLHRAGTPLSAAVFWLESIVTFTATVLIALSKAEFTGNKK